MENPHGFTTAPIHPRTRRGHTAQAKERRKESRERPRATGPMCPLYYQYIFFTHLGLKLSTPELSADKPPVKDASGYCPSIYRVIYTFRYWENRCQNQGTQQRVPKEPPGEGRQRILSQYLQGNIYIQILGKSVSKSRHSTTSAEGASRRGAAADTVPVSTG